VQKEGSANLRHSGVIGKNHFSPQLEKVLVQMKKGEKWTLEGMY
jgi:FKBP-type peptidyl-prolyl cis-trans isomerase 2